VQSKESSKDPLVDALVSELHDVAFRRVPNVFVKRGKQKELDIKHLRTITERNFPEEWQEDPANALELLLKRAISLLEGKFGDPPGDKKEDKRIIMQEAALRLFNIDDSP
jgi:hypothetical protein